MWNSLFLYVYWQLGHANSNKIKTTRKNCYSCTKRESKKLLKQPRISNIPTNKYNILQNWTKITKIQKKKNKF